MIRRRKLCWEVKISSSLNITGSPWGDDRHEIMCCQFLYWYKSSVDNTFASQCQMITATFLRTVCRKMCAVSLTGCMGALPCALGVVGKGGRLLMERWALIGWAWLRAVTSHGGEVLWCKITSPFMGRAGTFHSRREVRFCSPLSAPSVLFSLKSFSPICKKNLSVSWFFYVNPILLNHILHLSFVLLLLV